MVATNEWQRTSSTADTVFGRLPQELETQLRQAQKMELIGRLVGGIIHDLNNLLTVILGYSDLLLNLPGMAPQAREGLDEIDKAANRAADMVAQLLAFSRRRVLNPQVHNLNAVVANMDKLVRRLIGENIILTTTLEPELAEIRADLGQLEQVLLNLCVNARDAMPRGGRLTIQTANVELTDAAPVCNGKPKPGPHVMLSVSDTGCGMDAETQARLFEPFFTTKEPGRGTGLGLATVAEIVTQSDGCLWFESEPGHGTTFRIYLSRVEETESPPKTKKRTWEMPKGRETILLVEDDDSIRALARLVLKTQGYTVLEAKQGDAALEMAGVHPGPIHLLATDVVMPCLGGRELADRLLAQRPDLRVVFLSGYTEEAVVRHGVEHPRDVFLSKPFTPVALAHIIRKTLDA